MVEILTAFLVVLGLLISAEVIYRLADWVVFRANNLVGDMDEEE